MLDYIVSWEDRMVGESLPSSRINDAVPLCITGPWSSLSNARARDTVPVLEKPAPITRSSRVRSVGIEGVCPILKVLRMRRGMKIVETEKRRNEFEFVLANNLPETR